jgi:parallel beta-helix repeat protein
MWVKTQLWLLGGIMLFGGCAPYYMVDGSRQPVTITDSTIHQDTLWQGTIIIDGVVKLAAGATLVLAPGTRVEFTRRDDNRDGIGESGIYANGRVLAEGTKEQNIVFTSHSPSAKPASWGEIKVEYSLGSRFRFCRFEYADWGLHIHFSTVEVSHSVFKHNEGGLRFRSGPIKISHNLIQHNKIGLRFIHSEPVIEYNTISDNLTGIFIRERVRRPRITHNNIARNRNYNLKLGEAQHYSLDCPDNWWGTADIEVIERYIFDQRDADYIGRVNYIPIATHAW